MYQPGETIDRNYEVEKTLALGGAGVTYLVRGLGEDGTAGGPRMALKLLFASRDHGSYLQRLSTEAQILQQLDHPHIVQYLGFVHRSGQSPYLLTLFEEGGSLLDHMRRVGTLSIKATARIGRQVCWALEKGHSRSIIHRDLKPENMLLAEIVKREGDPHVRVADFGIAKVQGSLGSGLTRSGAFVGTPQYAAPEQFIGEAATAAADVYSLGAVMVFLMTARPVVKKAHLTAPEDVYLALQDKLPASINRTKDTEIENRRMNLILAQAMSFEAEQRCSVSQLDRMLEMLLNDQDPSTTSGAGPSDPGVSLKSLPPVLAPGHKPTDVDPIEPTENSAGTSEDTASFPKSTSTGTPQPDASSTGESLPPESASGTDSGVSESSDEPESTSAAASSTGRKLFRGVLLVLLLGLLGAGGWVGNIWLNSPWELEGQPVVGGKTPTKHVGKRTPKAKARRQELKPLLRRELQGYWRTCSKAKSPRKDLVVELVVEPDGTIRWIRPVDADAPDAHWCVTDKMRFTKLSKWKSKNPIQTRVKVEYQGQ